APRVARSAAARLLGRLSPSPRVLGRELEMELQLLLEFAIVAMTTERAEQSTNPLPDLAHDRAFLPASPRSRVAIIAAIRSHACCSFSSSRRPADVSAYNRAFPFGVV